MDVYIDDILVKLAWAINMILDLKETFNTTKQYKLKMNLEKYIFEVRGRKFLVYMVIERGIKTNLKKIGAI